MTYVYITTSYRVESASIYCVCKRYAHYFKSKSAIDKLKKGLSFEFEMKDLGEAKKVLGMKIERDRDNCKVSLTQKEYLRRYYRSSTSIAIQSL